MASARKRLSPIGLSLVLARWVLPSLILLAACAAPATADATAGSVTHRLQVELHPAAGRFEARDVIRLAPGTVPRFALHAGFEPRLLAPAGRLHQVGTRQGAVPLAVWEVTLPADAADFTLAWSGHIVYPPTEDRAAQGQRADSPGLIDARGVYLDPAAHWYPVFDAPLRFTLKVTGPEGWHAVSQGAINTDTDTDTDTDADIETDIRQGIIGAWREEQPQLGIWLVAGPFHVYTRPTAHGTAQAFLRAAEPALAETYLAATADYLALYSRLIGPYPYAKFALVENLWESGWGMPSFTLLGPRVIRLPFIPHTSYPHEILHSWWGNGVYRDPAQGNWSEGLTTYLADHLLAARRGQDTERRRAALQQYAEHAPQSETLSLSAFQGHHGGLSQAVGYGKGMMLFHMLRQELGDAEFLVGLRELYRRHLFEQLGFSEVQAAFEAASDRPLEGFFHQWVKRRGAPQLALEAVKAHREDAGWRLRGRLRQTQPGPPYRLRVPLAVQLAGADHAEEHIVTLKTATAEFDWTLPAEPQRLAVDPRFDVFRLLDPAELPASFGRLFAAPTAVFVIPSAAPADLQRAYRELAAAWSRPGDRVVRDDETLPTAEAIWVLGAENRLWPQVRATAGDKLEAMVSGEGSSNSKVGPGLRDQSVALALRSDGAAAANLGGVAAPDAAAVAELARKLPHYRRYSYVVFSGERNTARGEWPVRDSPLQHAFRPDAPALALPPRPALEAAATSARGERRD